MKVHSLVLLGALCVRVLAQSAPPTVQPPALQTVKVFALGPVGYAGTTSKEELEFRSVLALPPDKAKRQLEELYSSGNPQAMSYALAGIRKLDRQRYSELLVLARTSDLIVTTMSGCIVSEEKLRTVADDLDSGIYDARLR